MNTTMYYCLITWCSVRTALGNLRKSALTLGLMTRHITAEYVESFKELYHGNTDRKRQHEELGKVREKKDEAGVVKIMYRVMQQWNPFDIDTPRFRTVWPPSWKLGKKGIKASLSRDLLQKPKRLHFGRLIPGSIFQLLQIWRKQLKRIWKHPSKCWILNYYSAASCCLKTTWCWPGIHLSPSAGI